MSSVAIPKKTPYQNTSSLDLDLNTIEGTVPKDMAGHAFWMVPTPQGGDTPWFNGRGQLYRLDFHSDRVHICFFLMPVFSHRSRESPYSFLWELHYCIHHFARADIKRKAC